MVERTGMDMIRDAAEIASLHLAAHPHRMWLKIDANRIEKLGTTPRLLKLHVDKLDEDTELVLAPLWKRVLAG
jgi:hypothetical protein